MESYVRQVAADVRINGGNVDVEALLSTLTSEMIMSPNDFMACSNKELQEIGVPLGIIKRLQKLIIPSMEEPVVEPTRVLPTPKTHSPTPLPEPIVMYEDSSADMDMLQAVNVAMTCFADSLTTQDLSSNVVGKSTLTFQRILSKIIGFPLEVKYRKISTNSTVFANTIAVLGADVYRPVFDALKFNLIDLDGVPTFYLQMAVIPLLKLALDRFNDVGDSYGIAPVEMTRGPTFDPYKSAMASTVSVHSTVKNVLDVSRSNWKDEESDVHEKLAKLEKLYATGGIYKEIPELASFCEQSHATARPASPIVDAEGDCEDTDTSMHVEMLKMLISSKPTFKSRSRKVLSDLENRKAYTSTRIRFVLSGVNVDPRAEVLELNVHPAATNATLYQKVAAYLPEGIPFELFQSPPVTILDKQDTRSLMAQHMVPFVIVRVRSSSGTLEWFNKM